MHGNIAFKMPALKGSIVRPESIINSLNQVIAVNWMTSSKGKKQERNSLHWSHVIYNCEIKSKISKNNNINFKLTHDHHSGYCNLSNCKLTRKKNLRLQQVSYPWPLYKGCSALPTELWRPIHWEQANLLSSP